ncbi:MAG: diguanylate cyclase, partial [Thiomicrorhabdus sp.]|nr:diguanylate cyclase [Thiomicrorhabdus sp.]
MSSHNAIELRKNYIKRYALALFLIASLSTLAFTGLILALKGSDSSAYLVNISGKQRMLSQTIALDAYRICEIRQNATSESHQQNTLKVSVVSERLLKHIDEMALANQQLSTGHLISRADVAVSDELKELYFGQTRLASQVEEYLALAKGLAFPNPSEENRIKLIQLSEMSLSLVVDLDRAVKIYQKEGEQKLFYVKVVESVVWIVTILVLIFEAIFIFQPLVRQVSRFANKLESHAQELKNQVELRTLKLENMNQRLADLAYHDALTGLQNRLNLERDIERTVDLYNKYQTPFAVLMLDIDWFKAVNDVYGHDTGDFVLKEVAQLLLSSVRQKDFVYRAGGEEFVILFEAMSLDEAKNKAEEVRQRVEQHLFKYGEYEINKTASIGVYHSDLALPEDVKFVLKLVDDALYRSKAIGRNRVSLCD